MAKKNKKNGNFKQLPIKNAVLAIYFQIIIQKYYLATKY